MDIGITNLLPIVKKRKKSLMAESIFAIFCEVGLEYAAFHFSVCPTMVRHGKGHTNMIWCPVVLVAGMKGLLQGSVRFGGDFGVTKNQYKKGRQPRLFFVTDC